MMSLSNSLKNARHSRHSLSMKPGVGLLSELEKVLEIAVAHPLRVNGRLVREL
jgi:hypothetical protein